MSNVLLVKKILERADQYKCSLQGFGMLRMYLSDEVRLHVWDSRFRVPGVSDIHDHPWSFSSEVVVGRVENSIFFPRHDSDGKFNGARIVCGPKASVAPMGTHHVMASNLELTSSCSIGAGSSYWQSADTVHRSAPEDGTVTIVRRVFGADRDHARVFWPVGTEWVSAALREATPGEVRSITSASLERWFK